MENIPTLHPFSAARVDVVGGSARSAMPLMVCLVRLTRRIRRHCSRDGA